MGYGYLTGMYGGRVEGEGAKLDQGTEEEGRIRVRGERYVFVCFVICLKEKMQPTI